MKLNYEEPKFKVVSVNTKDVISTSGDDFNMQGDKVVNYSNSNWTIDI